MLSGRKLIIYNLFPLLAGPFLRWEKHLRRAASMGFNWVFVNPIQRSGASGSLYSVADYHQLDPRLLDASSSMSPQAQLATAVETARSLGLELMIDLVANHCAVDSPLVTAHPEWFVWDAPGRVSNPFCYDDGRKVVWHDLAQFDHVHTKDKDGLYGYFRSVTEWLYSLGFRAFRCDAAYQLPSAFWRRLISDVKSKHPSVLFLAETLGCSFDKTLQTAKAGFDYIFNSSKWWDLRGDWLIKQSLLLREVVPSVSFAESHDTPRLAEELAGRVDGLKQRYLVSALFSAGVMMPVGYEFAFRRRLHVVRTRPEDAEFTGVDIRPYIGKVNAIKATHPVFLEESPLRIEPSGDDKVLVLWKGSAHSCEEALIIVNRDVDKPHRFRCDDLGRFLARTLPLVDVSPDDQRMARVATKFEYELRPAQGLVLVARPEG